MKNEKKKIEVSRAINLLAKWLMDNSDREDIMGDNMVSHKDDYGRSTVYMFGSGVTIESLKDNELINVRVAITIEDGMNEG